MIDRKTVLAQAGNTADKEAIARGLDLAERALRFHETQRGDFSDPYQTAMLVAILEKVPGVAVAANGGFVEAERKRLIVCPDYLDPEEQDPGIAYLAVEGNFKFRRTGHRDFLGSLLGLGLRREKLGDILVDEHGVRLVVDGEVVDFIRTNLTRVGRNKVTVREIGRDELSPPQPEVKEIKATVPSLRLDVVAAQAFGLSRGKMAAEVAAEKVALNWRPCTNRSAPVQEGDLISVRGRGRAEVAAVTGQTKKGRIALLIKRYV